MAPQVAPPQLLSGGVRTLTRQGLRIEDHVLTHLVALFTRNAGHSIENGALETVAPVSAAREQAHFLFHGSGRPGEAWPGGACLRAPSRPARAGVP